MMTCVALVYIMITLLCDIFIADIIRDFMCYVRAYEIWKFMCWYFIMYDLYIRVLTHLPLLKVPKARFFSALWCIDALIARFMEPTWGPSGADRTQVGPMLVPWTLLSGWLDIFQRWHMEMSLTLTLISGNWWLILHDNLRRAYV